MSERERERAPAINNIFELPVTTQGFLSTNQKAEIGAQPHIRPVR